MRSVVCAIAVMVGAISASACGPAGVRELDSKNAKMTIPEKSDGLSVLNSLDDLAKSKYFTNDAGRDAIGKQVDFTKEKIVVVTWYGSSTSWVEVAYAKCGNKIAFKIVTGNPALADWRSHIHVFAVPKDANVETPMDHLKDLINEQVAAEPVKLSLKDVKFFLLEKNELPPKAIVIASVADLAKSKLFADDTSRDSLAKQIDFTKQKLVLFVWEGSGGDKIAAQLSKDGMSAVFTYTRGETDDLREHTLAFAVPKDREVKVVKVVNE